MFLEDLQSQRLSPIVSLDILHLCRKGKQILEDPKLGGVTEVLGLMGSSPLLLFRFLEWQQDLSEGKGFSLSKYLLRDGSEKHLYPHFKKVSSLFKGQLNFKALADGLRQFALDYLPDAFSSQLDPRQFKRPGFVSFSNRLPTLLERAIHEMGAKKGPFKLSDHMDDLQLDTLRKSRRLLESGMVDLMEDLVSKIERDAQQILGKRGMVAFLTDTLSKVSFLSLLGLARGGRGEHLHILNLHAMTCAEAALRLSRELHNIDQPIKGLASPEDLYLMGLIHDLGHALLLSHFPEIHAEIWEKLLNQEEQSNEQKASETQIKGKGEGEGESDRQRSSKFSKLYHEIEKEVIESVQKNKCLKILQNLPKPQLQIFLETIIKEKPELANTRSSQNAITSYVDAYLRSFYFKEDAWALKLWDSLKLPELTPLSSSNELAAQLLIKSAKGQELVKGAYDNFAKFVRSYGQHHSKEQPKESSTSVMFIRLCNDITTQLSESTEFSFPCSYGNIGGAEPFVQRDELCGKLDISEHTLEKKINIVLKDLASWSASQQTHGQTHHSHPLLHPQILQNDLQLSFANFFNHSEFFKSDSLKSSFLKFNHLMHDITNILRNNKELTPSLFVSEIEKSLRHFFRILEVVFKPREITESQSPDQHFAVIFESSELADDVHIYHHRHLIGDIYLMDHNTQTVRHSDVHHFLKLFCDNLLLSHSSEIWELFKGKKEIARMDIAREMITRHRLGPGLNSELMYLKARVLDGVLQRFSADQEPQHILRLHFATFFRSKSPMGLEIFPTPDFDYWKQRAGDDAPEYNVILDDLSNALILKHNEIKEGIGAQKAFEPFEISLDTIVGTLPALMVSLFPLDDVGNSQFILILTGSTQKRDAALLERLLDKGAPQQLARHHSDITQPVGLTFLNFFGSDESTSSISRLTHLRPSRLKEMGNLLRQVRREIQPLSPRLPKVISTELNSFLSLATDFWEQHQNELNKSSKLNRDSLKSFDILRKKSDQFKKGIRFQLSDFSQLLQEIPGETLGKLRLADPLLCIPWGLEHLYLSYGAFLKFRDSVDKKINHGHPQLREAAEILHRLESAWFISHKDHLKQAFLSFFEELSRESHIAESQGPVSCTLTLFLYEQTLPAHPNCTFPHLALECFTPGPTREGGLQRLVGSAGSGYHTIFRDEFLEFSAIAHRNIMEQSSGQHLMECFFRENKETPSVRYVDPHLHKYRFLNSTGISTLFFFPCKAQHLGRQQHHGF